MAISLSVDKVDKEGRELLTYGTPDFPIAFFDDDLARTPVSWHWHDEIELLIVTEGTVNVKIANSSFVLNRGEGYFANSGTLHTETLISESGHQHCMVFSPQVIAGEKDRTWNRYIAPVLGCQSLPYMKLTQDVQWQKEILQLTESAWLSGAHEKKDYPLKVSYELGKVFSILADHLNVLTMEMNYTDKFQKDELRIKKAMNFIENSYASEITVSEIAKSADISVSSCLRLFRDVLNTTPIQFLIDYRVRKAAAELESSNREPISEIAFSCGFPDATYFNRCFKKKYGCTPTEYIKRQNFYV